MSLVPYGNNEMAELNQLAQQLSSFSGESIQDTVNFVNNASADTLAITKMFMKNLKQVGNAGNDLVPVTWRASVNISNTDTIDEEYYLSPGMLAAVGNAGLFKGTGEFFSGIGLTTNKLKVLTTTVNADVFYRYLYQFATYTNRITVAASTANGIQNGYIDYSTMSPSTTTGTTSPTKLLLANYNLSESYQSTKAEIFDGNYYLGQYNVMKVNVLAGESVSYTLDLISYVPKIYAEAFGLTTAVAIKR